MESPWKRNEITAIPALLVLLALDGCLVSTGALGCQKAYCGASPCPKGRLSTGSQG